MSEQNNTISEENVSEQIAKMIEEIKSGQYNICAEKIKIAMVKENDMKLSKLAKLTSTSSPNISNKLKRNNISETDLRTLAYALGYDVEINLVKRGTGEKI